jgi:hypothetical protein
MPMSAPENVKSSERQKKISLTTLPVKVEGGVHPASSSSFWMLLSVSDFHLKLSEPVAFDGTY